MSEGSVETLFDEFALAYRRGERPDVGEYLARAPEGAERDDLASLIDRFLQAVPAREPSEEEVVLVQARLDQQPPLLTLRIRRKLSRESVVAALVKTLGLDPAKRAKVGSYYHELETGLLDPEPVSASVWDALSELLQANVRALTGLRREPPAAQVAYHREPAIELDVRRLEAEPSLPEEPDDIDRLFLGPNEP